MNEEQHAMLVRIDERTLTLVNGHEDQERRIRNLERFRNWAAGVVAAIGSGLGITNIPNG